MAGRKIWIAATCVLALCVAALGVVCIDCQSRIQALTQETGDAPEASARISLTVEPESPEEAARLREIDAQEPMEPGEQKKHHPYVLEYQGASRVTVHLASGDVELRDALDSGDVTLPRLVAQAEEDAAEGICKQRYYCDSEKTRLCWTVYCYPDFNMGVMTDMYEEELWEEQYLFRYVVFAPAGTEISGPCTMRRDEDTFASICRQRLGLTTTPRDVTPGGLTLAFTLTDEWFDGAVYLGDILSLAREKDGEWETLKPLKETQRLNSNQIKALGQAIPTGGEAEYAVSWEDSYGQLESGTYNLRMVIRVGGRNGGAIKVRFTIP